jgi:hypothetical protein
MGPVRRTGLGASAATAVGVAVLIATASALAASSIIKSQIGSIRLRAGQTRTLTVPYPDALEYGNARYSGHVRIKLLAGKRPARPASVEKVRILEAESVEGGSAFQVRAHNANASGTAAVELVVTATTVEPLPHT